MPEFSAAPTRPCRCIALEPQAARALRLHLHLHLHLRRRESRPTGPFGPIWTTIFACAAVAGINAWRRAPDRASQDGLLVGFAFTGFRNVLWSVLYFRLRRPDGSHAEVALLWANRPFGG